MTELNINLKIQLERKSRAHFFARSFAPCIFLCVFFCSRALDFHSKWIEMNGMVCVVATLFYKNKDIWFHWDKVEWKKCTFRMVGCCCCCFVALKLSYDGCPTPFFGGVVDVTIMNANDKVLFNLFQCEYRTLIINTYSALHTV